MGPNAGRFNSTGRSNSFFGYEAGNQNTTGKSNVYLGASAGPGPANGSDSQNVFIGHNVGVNGSNKLAIDNYRNNFPLVAGDFFARYITINGTLTSTGTMTAPNNVTASDSRLKKNIAPLQSALEGVEKLNGVYYSYKADAPDGNTYPKSRQIGVIAQDVEKVYPELVVTQPGGFKAVDYPKLTAVLIEAVKELQIRLEKVENELKVSRREQKAGSKLAAAGR